ncbi:hypothetical protein SELMODRAFT_425637 [Selaginella moellendorffii]|uniref:Uncharacterized protein n=1 Tax=Selaginella moellendorffii TaxID=88036 RepID=D8STR8_SELML|nr:hypothetical protein SELMODRAFT_425637 [Selaginella moellendorffii]
MSKHTAVSVKPSLTVHPVGLLGLKEGSFLEPAKKCHPFFNRKENISVGKPFRSNPSGFYDYTWKVAQPRRGDLIRISLSIPKTGVSRSIAQAVHAVSLDLRIPASSDSDRPMGMVEFEVVIMNEGKRILAPDDPIEEEMHEHGGIVKVSLTMIRAMTRYIDQVSLLLVESQKQKGTSRRSQPPYNVVDEEMHSFVKGPKTIILTTSDSRPSTDGKIVAAKCKSDDSWSVKNVPGGGARPFRKLVKTRTFVRILLGNSGTRICKEL